MCFDIRWYLMVPQVNDFVDTIDILQNMHELSLFIVTCVGRSKGAARALYRACTV